MWATSPAEERAAFERFVDFVIHRWRQFPALHIYHYAPYEPAALKRLMGRYATREDEIDIMLRNELFVDLFAVTRQAIRASVESYSLKKLEPFFGFTREKPMDEANLALAQLQSSLELGSTHDIDQALKDDVQAYNRDDCISTQQLRGWLETHRHHAIEHGATIPRPMLIEGRVSANLTEWMQRVETLVESLTTDLPPDPTTWTNEQQVTWTLAHSIDFHRREDKSKWWEYFRLRELPANELLSERAGLAGLNFIEEVGGTARAPIHRYRFQPQESDVRDADDLRQVGGDKVGSVAAISYNSGTVDIKKRQDSRDTHPQAVFTHKIVGKEVIAEAVFRIAEYVSLHGLTGPGAFAAARDLLLREGPREITPPLVRMDEDTLQAAQRLMCTMDEGVIAIQGPPGTGKTYTGSRMVCELVRQGKTVGITANSHKVIQNLLEGVAIAAVEEGVQLTCFQKVSEKQDGLYIINGITEGFHNKMEMLSRRAYGFRNFENYRLRVLAHCGWDGIVNRI